MFKQSSSSIHEACEGGHMEAVQTLVDLGAVVNKQVSWVIGLEVFVGSNCPKKQ